MNKETCLSDCIDRIQLKALHDPDLASKLKYDEGREQLKKRHAVPENVFGQINVICDEKSKSECEWVEVFLKLLETYDLPHQVFDSTDSPELKMREDTLASFKGETHFQELTDYTLVLVFEPHFLLHGIKAFSGDRMGGVVVDGNLPQQGVDDLRESLSFTPTDVRISDDRSRHRLLNIYWDCVQFFRESRDLLKPLYDRSSSSIFLLHGKGTFGKWQPILQEFFDSRGFHVECGNYDFVNQLSFFNPRRVFLRKKISEIQDTFSGFCERAGGNRKFAIAHSMGSFLFAKAIQGADVCLNGLILCGSIVPKEAGAELAQCVDRPEHIINEVGNADIWPAVASGFFVPYGQVGFDGFRNSGIKDRFHTDFRHSDFFEGSFPEEYWLPFFQSGDCKSGTSQGPNTNWKRTLLARLPLEFWILFVTVSIVFLGCLVGAFTGFWIGVSFGLLLLAAFLWYF